MRRQQTKLKSPYDPDPYTVLEVHGTQIVARRREKLRSRDAQFWKKVDTEPRRDFTALKQRGIRREDDYLPDIGPPGLTPPSTVVSTSAPAVTPDSPDRLDPNRAAARQPVREGWSFDAPATWTPPARSRPLTRSTTARREAVRATARGEAGSRRGRGRDRGQ